MRLRFYASKRNCSEYTDSDFVRLLTGSEAESNQAINCLHDLYFDLANKAINFHQLAETDVYDVYTDSLLELRKNVQAGKFENRGSLKAYFAMTFRNRCVDKFRALTTNKVKPLEETPVTYSPVQPDELLIEWESMTDAERKLIQTRNCLDQALAGLTQRERDMLTDYCIHKIKPAAIAVKYGYRNGHTAASTLNTLKRKAEQAIRKLCEQDPACSIICKPGDFFNHLR